MRHAQSGTPAGPTAKNQPPMTAIGPWEAEGAPKAAHRPTRQGADPALQEQRAADADGGHHDEEPEHAGQHRA